MYLQKNPHEKKNKKGTNFSIWMEYYCKISDKNHKNDLKLFETPDLSWF